jgi:hypothetical protein
VRQRRLLRLSEIIEHRPRGLHCGSIRVGEAKSFERARAKVTSQCRVGGFTAEGPIRADRDHPTLGPQLGKIVGVVADEDLDGVNASQLVAQAFRRRRRRLETASGKIDPRQTAIVRRDIERRQII